MNERRAAAPGLAVEEVALTLQAPVVHAHRIEEDRLEEPAEHREAARAELGTPRAPLPCPRRAHAGRPGGRHPRRAPPLAHHGGQTGRERVRQ